MSAATLIRWSGASLAIGGIAVAGFVVALVPGGGFGATPQDLGATYLLAHGSHTVGGVLALLGLVGLYVRLRERSATLAFVGFFVAFVGTTFFDALGLMSELVVPALSAPLTEAQLAPLFAITFLPFLAGYVLLGVAVFRDRAFLRWSGPLLIVSAVLFALPWPWPVPVAGAIAYAVALASLGSVLWSRTAVTASQARSLA